MRAIAVDGVGSAYVTGDSGCCIGLGSDYLTVKYDSVGNEAWQARYDGGSDEVPSAIAVDPDGNSYVTGNNRTIKYSSLSTPATPTPIPTATPIPVPCGAECWLAGFWHSDFTGEGTIGNCSMTITQSTPTNFSTTSSCTVNTSLSVGIGTIDLVSRAISTTSTLSSGMVVTATGQISPDGNAVTGTWCTPNCTYNGTGMWTRILASYSTPMTQASGGTIVTALGDTLTVPSGALSSDQTITIDLEPLPIAPPPGYGSLRTAYEFGPSGLTFNSPVTAVFHYGNGDIPPGVPPENLRIYVLQNGVWSFVGGVVDTIAMTLTVQLSHFSTYGGFAPLAPAAPSVGGIAQQPDLAALPLRTSTALRGHRVAYEVAAAAGALAVVAVGAGATRRRRQG